MTRGLIQVKFLCFAIIAKQKFVNSILLGSSHAISLKIGLSDHQTRKFINYGISNGLISKTNYGYRLSGYSKIIDNIDAVTHKRHTSFYKEGNFNELVKKNLFAVASVKFKQQQYKIDRFKSIEIIKQKIATGHKGITRKEYDFYKKNKNSVQGESFIVTGQKSISKMLNISQGYADKLLSEWGKLKLIFRTIMYSKYFDPFNEDNPLLNLDNKMVCLGSKIILIP